MDARTSTASEAVRALAAGEVSSVELLDALLARLERVNPTVNAVVALDVERARVAARAADDARARGDGAALGPLQGLPMTIKDSYETEGVVTTSGAPEHATHVPDRDADAVALLKAAGAVVYGKTNVPLFTADYQTSNDVYGLTRNPWNPERTAGGSSGGAAAAVATGMSLLELGSDIAGSIRVPAHYNGVFGHKPTFGAVPHRGHIPPPPGGLARPDLGVFGPLGRSVADLELAMDVLGVGVAGVPGARLPAAGTVPPDLGSCRIGVWIDDPAAPLDPPVAAVLRAAVDALADGGAVVRDDVRPATPLADAHTVYLQLLLAVMTSGYPAEVKELLAAVAAEADPDDRSFAVTAARASVQSHHDWMRADARRARLTAEWGDVFDQVDVVLAPIAPVAAFPHDIETPFQERRLQVGDRTIPYPEHMIWAGPATLSGLPATAIPAGRTTDGLPVGVQVIGPRWGDRRTLRIAGLLEQHLGGFVPPPDHSSRARRRGW